MTCLKPIKSQHDEDCNAVSWIPLSTRGEPGGNQCWRKNSRCLNAQPNSDNTWKYPWLEGAISAYKFHTAEDEFVHSKSNFIF